MSLCKCFSLFKFATHWQIRAACVYRVWGEAMHTQWGKMGWTLLGHYSSRITKAWDSLDSTSPTTRTLPSCYEFGCGPVMESSSVSTRERVKQMVHMCTYNNILSYKRGRLHHCIMNTMDPGRWYPKQALREILPVLNIPMQSKTRST